MDVPSAEELFTPELFESMRQTCKLEALIQELRHQEDEIVERLKELDSGELWRLCSNTIDADLLKADIRLSDAAHESPRSYFDAIRTLPFSGKTAFTRRQTREESRVLMLLCEGLVRTPSNADELSELWEQAMLGEPRWSEDHPSSKLRTGSVSIRRGNEERTVLHLCMPAEKVPQWLDVLFLLLGDTNVAEEIRAGVGLCLHDWIHPFFDGNGHTGRLLAQSLISTRYSLPTCAFFARELVVRRTTLMQAFASLRERKSDVEGFCTILLGQLSDAHALVLNELG